MVAPVRLDFDVTLFALVWVWVGGVEAVRMKIFFISKSFLCQLSNHQSTWMRECKWAREQKVGEPR
jgi:hypothetical protein